MKSNLNFIHWGISFLICLSLFGCMGIIRSYMGIKKSRFLTDEEIIKCSEKFKINSSELYKLDLSKYKEMCDQIVDSSIRKDLYQPLQLKSFVKGIQHSHLINCTTYGGLRKLDWNHYGAFDSFPVTYGASRKVDTSFTLNVELGFIISLGGNSDDSLPFAADEVLIVYWNRMMNIHSRDLVEFVQTYRKNNPKRNIFTCFVNTDNFYKEVFH